MYFSTCFDINDIGGSFSFLFVSWNEVSSDDNFEWLRFIHEKH